MPTQTSTWLSSSQVQAGMRRFRGLLFGFRGERLALRAGNLTFITVTSIVPMAAVVLSLVHLFQQAQLEVMVLRFFEQLLSPGGRMQADLTVKKFLVAANSRAAGGASFTFLLVSAGLMLRHLDAALNDVWAVRRSRNVFLSVLIYSGVLLAGPALMSVALLGQAEVRRWLLLTDFPFASVLFALGPVLLSVVLFSLLYKLAPHAPVKTSSALIGGATAGVAFEVSRHGYAQLASLFFSSNPVYGSIGIAPLFLMWIYLAWYLVLSGARLAYAYEHAAFHDEFEALLDHPRSEELIAARVAQLVTTAHVNKTAAPTVAVLSKTLNLPLKRVNDLVFLLQGAGLVIVTKGEIYCASEPETLSLADLSLAVGGQAGKLKTRRGTIGQFALVASVFDRIDESSREKLKQISWADLALKK
jgi:membrane protein